MTLTAQIRCLIKGYCASMVLLPKLASAVVTVAGGFVQGLPGLAESGVCRSYKFPVDDFKPGSFHAGA
jgi:hypothetical protein